MGNDKNNTTLDQPDLESDGLMAEVPEASGPFQIDDLITRMTQTRSRLRPAERRVADVVLEDIEAAVRASNSQLARAAGVSEPTVTRFCRTMGCDGVRDFKLRLAQSLVAGPMSLHASAGESEGSAPAFWNAVFGHARQAIGLAERQLDAAAVNDAIECIACADRVFVFGLGGGSTSLAMDMQFRLFRFGISVLSYTDAYLMRMVAATVRANDVVVIISATGRTSDLVEAAETARQYNARVVALTRPGSELAEAAEIALTIDVPEVVNVLKPTASRFAFLAALDVLATGIAYRLGPEAHETIRRVKLNLIRKSGGDVLEPLGD